MSNYCVIGSGRQGTSTAYDIIKNLSPSRLDLIDANQENLDSFKISFEKYLKGFFSWKEHDTVSYTHLTLPTKA